MNNYEKIKQMNHKEITKFLTVLFVTNAVFLLGYTQDFRLLIPLNAPIIISFLIQRGSNNDR